MGIQKEVSQLEVNMMDLLVAAFRSAEYKKLESLKQYLSALEELEAEYLEITQVGFIKEENFDRLLASIKQLTEEAANANDKAKTR